MAEHPLAPPGFVWLPSEYGFDALFNVNRIDSICPDNGNPLNNWTKLRYGSGYVIVLLPIDEVAQLVEDALQSSPDVGGERFVGAGIPG